MRGETAQSRPRSCSAIKVKAPLGLKEAVVASCLSSFFKAVSTLERARDPRTGLHSNTLVGYVEALDSDPDFSNAPTQLPCGEYMLELCVNSQYCTICERYGHGSSVHDRFATRYANRPVIGETIPLKDEQIPRTRWCQEFKSDPLLRLVQTGFVLDGWECYGSSCLSIGLPALPFKGAKKFSLGKGYQALAKHVRSPEHAESLRTYCSFRRGESSGSSSSSERQVPAGPPQPPQEDSDVMPPPTKKRGTQKLWM